MNRIIFLRPKQESAPRATNWAFLSWGWFLSIKSFFSAPRKRSAGDKIMVFEFRVFFNRWNPFSPPQESAPRAKKYELLNLGWFLCTKSFFFVPRKRSAGKTNRFFEFRVLEAGTSTLEDTGSQKWRPESGSWTSTWRGRRASAQGTWRAQGQVYVETSVDLSIKSTN